jgi:hypothetical protein
MGARLIRSVMSNKEMKDIPQLTEFLENNPIFIKYALKVNKGTNFGLSEFQRLLHESAFPEEFRKHKNDPNSKKVDDGKNKKD